MRALYAAVVVTTLIGACGGGGGSGSGSGLSGRVSVDGSSTVGPITEAVAEEFGAEQPDVEVAVGVSGTGGGFEKFCAGEVDLNDASRPIKQEERDACAKNGIEPVELKVALDGLAVVANPDVTWVKCLTFEQLRAIWDQGSTVKRWRDLDPDMPDEALPLFGPGTDSGTFDFFTDEVNGEEGRSRSDYTASEDDNVLVRGISGQPGALGYFGIAYYEQNRSRLKAIAVDKGDGKCISPSAKTVRTGTYPLSRPLYVYLSSESAARPQVAEFVSFYLDVVNDIIAEVGYVGLPADELDASRRAASAATK